MTDILKEMLSEKDEAYKSFQGALLPTVPPDRMIGVRTPVLRRMAKRLDDDKKRSFIIDLPHRYYEENNLHSFILSGEKDFERCMAEIEKFLPHIDNWATCDGLRPVCIKGNEDRLLKYIDRWLESGKCYTVRFAAEMLMVHYMGEHFRPEYPEKIAKIKSDEYYVNMMSAWYFATLLTKRWDNGISYIEKRLLSPFVHAKTISKVSDSLAVPKEKKEYIKKLR